MIHVAMRDEDIAHAKEFPGGQRRQVTKIEKDGPPPEPKVDKQARIRKRFIDQTALNQPTHAFAPDRSCRRALRASMPV
jgi:hypothetical protein